MRIVGGKLKGSSLATPKSSAIRPTTDRTRESLFNILAHREDVLFDGARVIDLFAGTGALGFEALSRGAAFALFVDESAEARGLIRKNMETVRQNGTAKLFRRDAAKIGTIGTMLPFTLAFLDPPYNRGLAEKALAGLHQGGWLEPGAVVVVEEAADAPFTPPSPFFETDGRKYGSSLIRFLSYTSEIR